MLASIQKIISVEPIENADRIEKVKVLGWDCVVRKNLFKPEDLCIYVEIDTIIPKYLFTEEWKDWEEFVRLKTVKMKGQISQGLVLPLFNSSFQTIVGNESDDCFNIGRDVSELLHIKKYEKAIPENMQGVVKSDFPSFLTKTDEVKIQSSEKLLNNLVNQPYYISVKIDGTSATYYKKEGIFGACSRNLELKEEENVYWTIARKYKLEEIIPDGICIQGEIAGPAIQENKLQLNEPQFFVFNIYTILGHKNWTYQEMEEFCKGNNLTFVPIIETQKQFNYSQDDLMKIADNLNYSCGNKAEGIVVRSLDQNISFKVVSNKFLLKYEE